MRVPVLIVLATGFLFAQQPIVYYRGVVNAASLAPFGLPNAPIAAGSVFTVFGENLGPAAGQSVSAFPLNATFQGVSISITQGKVTTQAYPIFVSASQVNAVMPSSVTGGLATLRLFYNSAKSNAATIQIAKSAPGIFAISSGGFGPAIVQNFVTSDNQPINSSAAPTAPGQTITIWGTGLGPVNFPDNVAPTAGNVSTPVTVTVGRQPAQVLYSGRSPCCSGVDQMVVTLAGNVPLGCFVPVTVNAGGVVSNTTTIAVAAQGATSCSDPSNPLSALVLQPGTQGFVSIGHTDKINNVNFGTPKQDVLDKFYSRYFTRPNSPFNFDPYMSYPPAGTCLVNQTSSNVANGAALRGVLPASASLAQPNQAYNNGTQTLGMSPKGSDYATSLGGTLSGVQNGLNPMSANAAYILDFTGPNQLTIPLEPEPPPVWSRPNAIIRIPRATSLSLSFTPGDSAAPTAIVINAYAASVNSTVQVECLAAPGATSFTIPADTLANLPPSYQIADGSYANLFIGTLGFNHAASFNNALVSHAIVVLSNWVGQSAVIQ